MGRGSFSTSSGSPRLRGALLLLLLVSSCSPAGKPAASGTTFRDELGREVTIPSPPARIISLAPSITEMLFAAGAGDRLVGVTTYCDYPPEALKIEKVGDTQKPSLEKIIALRPDLVIISTSSQLQEFAERLGEQSIPVYVSNPRNLDGMIESLLRIGDITGTGDRARREAAQLRNRIDAVHRRVEGLSRPRVFFIVSSEPLMTAGGCGFINDLIEGAGGRSITAGEKADFPQYSMETALASQPEVIFLQSGDSRLPDRLSQTPAARAGRVFQLDDNLILRPGPRLVDGLEQMAARIHPEAFGKAGN